MKYFNVLVCFIFIASCSGNQKVGEQGSDSLALSSTSEEDLINEALEDIEQSDASFEKDIMAEEVTELAEQEPLSAEKASLKIDEIAYYEVKKNESLMLISYKLYGDYLKWKQLAKLNKNKLSSGHMLREGMKIKYYVPEEKFQHRPQGTPYLVKKGDYLSKISHRVYGQASRWVEIWENNKPMIKDPDLIFVGFTLYYKDSKREFASN